LIVTLDDMPMNPWLDEIIQERLVARGVRAPERTAPLQVIGIDDLELLPSLLDVSKLSIGELLAMKASDRPSALRNFLFAERPEWAEAARPPDWMKQRFTDLMDRVVAMIGSAEAAPES
jgi:hypothetical protein